MFVTHVPPMSASWTIAESYTQTETKVGLCARTRAERAVQERGRVPLFDIQRAVQAHAHLRVCALIHDVNVVLGWQVGHVHELEAELDLHLVRNLSLECDRELLHVVNLYSCAFLRPSPCPRPCSLNRPGTRQGGYTRMLATKTSKAMGMRRGHD